jgi:ATP-binding cassette, subfamily B, bacterial
VRFEYVPDRPVLHGISATVQPNEVVGIVGPSGSGKSTLVQLLLGLRAPTSGTVLADGRPIDTLARAEWVRKVAFVPQAAHLLRGSVADNIRFLRDHLTDDDVERAALLAHLHDEIVAFPDGYAHDVGEGGSHLSGGQQQRLCLARALAGDPEVLVLDEPTSALDGRSEALVRETLAELAHRMTIVIVAHRTSTLEVCDRIMVVQSGQLVAFDTPFVLQVASPAYRDITNTLQP